MNKSVTVTLLNVHHSISVNHDLRAFKCVRNLIRENYISVSFFFQFLLIFIGIILI
jgi:hypothetical protein